MGGVFAVSTVLPEKILRLAYHLGTINSSGTGGVLEHSLQVLGCFLVLSVLIWASKSEPHPVRPLLAYPPHNSETVTVHTAGLMLGVVLLLATRVAHHADELAMKLGEPYDTLIGFSFSEIQTVA